MGRNDVAQMKNGKTGLWAKLVEGRIFSVKKDGTPYAGIRKIRVKK